MPALLYQVELDAPIGDAQWLRITRVKDNRNERWNFNVAFYSGDPDVDGSATVELGSKKRFSVAVAFRELNEDTIISNIVARTRLKFGGKAYMHHNI